MGIVLVLAIGAVFFWLGWMLRASCCDCLAFRKDQRPARDDPAGWFES